MIPCCEYKAIVNICIAVDTLYVNDTAEASGCWGKILQKVVKIRKGELKSCFLNFSLYFWVLTSPSKLLNFSRASWALD